MCSTGCSDSLGSLVIECANILESVAFNLYFSAVKPILFCIFCWADIGCFYWAPMEANDIVWCVSLYMDQYTGADRSSVCCCYTDHWSAWCYLHTVSCIPQACFVKLECFMIMRVPHNLRIYWISIIIWQLCICVKSAERIKWMFLRWSGCEVWWEWHEWIEFGMKRSVEELK